MTTTDTITITGGQLRDRRRARRARRIALVALSGGAIPTAAITLVILAVIAMWL